MASTVQNGIACLRKGNRRRRCRRGYLKLPVNIDDAEDEAYGL